MGFHSFEDTFGTISTSMTFEVEIEAVATARFIQRSCAIDEKHSIIDVAFLTGATEERVSDNVLSGRLKLCVEKFVEGLYLRRRTASTFRRRVRSQSRLLQRDRDFVGPRAVDHLCEPSCGRLILPIQN